MKLQTRFTVNQVASGFLGVAHCLDLATWDNPSLGTPKGIYLGLDEYGRPDFYSDEFPSECSPIKQIIFSSEEWQDIVKKSTAIGFEKWSNDYNEELILVMKDSISRNYQLARKAPSFR